MAGQDNTKPSQEKTDSGSEIITEESTDENIIEGEICVFFFVFRNWNYSITFLLFYTISIPIFILIGTVV